MPSSPEEAPPVPRTAPDETPPPPASRRASSPPSSLRWRGEPTGTAGAEIGTRRQAHLHRLSNRNFYWRMHVSKLVLDEAMSHQPFHALRLLPAAHGAKRWCAQATTNLLSRWRRVWVFGTRAWGSRCSSHRPSRLKKRCASTDIADLPDRCTESPRNAPRKGRD